MKKRLISVFAFALAVSAGAAFVLYQLISTKVTAGAAASARPATKTVFVAARDLEPGVMVKERDIETQEYLTVPAGAITRKEDIVNHGVINAIHRDAPFFQGTLASEGAGAGFASIIPPGMRALAVKVNEVAGVAGFAVAGMHVDVLVVGTPPGAGHEAVGSVSRTLLQDITVLSAGQNYQKDAEGKPVLVAVVNLLVTPAQAEVLTLATDERIQLVLRNPADQAIAQTPGAATSNLFEGSVIRAPQLASFGPAPGARRPGMPSATGPAARRTQDSAAARRSQEVTASVAPAATAAEPVHSIEVLSGSTRTQVMIGKTSHAEIAGAGK